MIKAFLICLFLAIGGVPLITALVNLSTKFYDTHTYPYNRWLQYAKNGPLNTKITFTQFYSFFSVAPEEWEITDNYAYHKGEKGNDIYIYFSKKDFKLYQKFYKRYTNPEDKGKKALLKEVREDIDKKNEQALKEQKKASDQLANYVKKQQKAMKGEH